MLGMLDASPCEWFRTLLLKPRVCIQTTWCFAPDLDSRLQNAVLVYIKFEWFKWVFSGFADAESKGLKVNHILYIVYDVYQYAIHSRCILIHILCTHRYIHTSRMDSYYLWQGAFAKVTSSAHVLRGRSWAPSATGIILGWIQFCWVIALFVYIYKY